MADQDLPPGTTPDTTAPWEDEAPERDDLTADIFGAAPPAAAAAPAPIPTPTLAPTLSETVGSGAAYTVLARKYRPQSFEDMIGQEAMVRTLTNAFASGRIAHGFMLTGVRGVGKTTTARLLARALNYESDTVHQPSVTDLATPGRHCAAITEGRHIDVLELDAASRSRVDEMRELLDGVRYAPAEARYKVYVIDEVHMLSTAAFNALLKTLEEPPPHAKFIFATTEIRKVPVTILSRCQRFDLRRVEPDVLVRHLSAITAKEGARIEAEALTLVARAAEGSVRDSLSLLDQAIVQGEAGQTVTAATVRDMLGLADRAQTIGLFEKTVRGEAGPAIEAFRALYGFGADPAQVVSDLLEHCHGASVAKALGPDVLVLPKDQAASLAALGAALSAGSLSRLWQMLLKAYDEVRRAPDPAAAVEMALIRLAYAADLPGPEEALKALQSGEAMGGGGGPRGGGASGGGQGGGGQGGGGALNARAAFQTQPRAEAHAAPQTTLQSFDDVVRLIDERRDIGLKLDVERFMRPISFRMGAITFEPAPGAPVNLAQRLVARLKEWTGQPWLVAAEGSGGAETLLEREKRERARARQEALSEPFVQAVMQAFPGTELVEIRQLAAPEIAAPADDEPNDDDDDQD
ncbi:DNA polymerase III subunit gamma/tau [Caulobacter sp. KR2-114]|uniref:DNA polymerase III subunit gamma/tau n=1 Tax=Caulobacter sp. KR2-114 TaxID=3400912 RepID=UPI003C03971B